MIVVVGCGLQTEPEHTQMKVMDTEIRLKQIPSMIRFFQRGGAWVLGQGVLLGGVALLAVRFRGGGFPAAIVIAGAMMMIVGAAVACRHCG